MAAKRACESKKFKEQIKIKGTKKQPTAKVSPGMASILEREELTQLSDAVSRKAQNTKELLHCGSFLSTSTNLQLKISRKLAPVTLTANGD